MMLCKGCANGRRNSRDGIYCMLFGIMIHGTHRGCKYFQEKDEGNDTDKHRHRLDDSAAEKGR